MKKSPYLLECCVDSVESAMLSAKAGADRLELCANLLIGGTTPSLALFEKVREKTDTRLHVLLRPRFGDFLYSDDEFEILLREARFFREAGADGLVIGCLKPDGSLDYEKMAALMDAAGPLSVTLHRAFDMCADPFSALETAGALGISTVLTSGQKASALEGSANLKQFVEYAKGLTIMAGAGVNAAAVQRLLQDDTGLKAFHMSGKQTVCSAMQYKNADVNMGLPGISEYERWVTDPRQILAVQAVLAQAALQTS